MFECDLWNGFEKIILGFTEGFVQGLNGLYHLRSSGLGPARQV